MWRFEIIDRASSKVVIHGLSAVPSKSHVTAGTSAIMWRITKPTTCQPCKQEIFAMLAEKEVVRNGRAG